MPTNLGALGGSSWTLHASELALQQPDDAENSWRFMSGTSRTSEGGLRRMAPGMPDAEVADLRNAREQPGSSPGRPVDGRQHVDRGGHCRH